MIKRIQLRGISRTPSDRMTADGGCSESLNVQLEHTETAPMLVPEDITSRYGTVAAEGLPGPALFIHKGRGYANLIYSVPGDAGNAIPASVKAFKEFHTGDTGAALPVYTLQEGEKVQSVTSVGNTLVILTNQRTEYVLYKEGEYIDLGDHIPIPVVDFHSIRFDPEGRVGDQTDPITEQYTINVGTDSVVYGVDKLRAWDAPTWRSYFRGDHSGHEDAYSEIVNTVWDQLTLEMKSAKELGYFVTPVFARYALRLSDDTYIYQSVPVLLGASDTDFFKAQGLRRHIDDNGTDLYVSSVKSSLLNLYKMVAKLHEYDYEGWEDIVSSIDIFLSTDIHWPLLNSKITGVESNSEESTSDLVVYDLSFAPADADSAGEKLREEILSKSVFYKVATFDVNNTAALEEGYDLMSKEEFVSQDYLVVQPTLPDDYLSSNRKLAESLFRYNNKVIMTGITQEIATGYTFINGSVVRDGEDPVDDNSVPAVVGRVPGGGGGSEPVTLSSDDKVYSFKFYVRDPSNNVLTVMARDYEGNAEIDAEGHYGVGYGYGWIAYPDTRCFRVDVEVVVDDVASYRTYKMEEHPGLNCAFAFIGLDKKIGLEGGEELDSEEWDETESRLYREDNIIWASEIDNPFVFPVNGRVSFYSTVIAIANATKALSEGQFGQFPLYVFTKDGIWAVPVSEEGNFVASVPLSRDVLISRDAMQPIEQAIVFVSAQGVMLLQDSSVTCLSETMNGANYLLPQEVVDKLDGIQPEEEEDEEDDETSAEETEEETAVLFSEAFVTTETFGTFIKSCRIAYDYANRRLIFMKNGYSYAYVYRLETQTWHKFSMLGYGQWTEREQPLRGLCFNSPLNSYPDCWIGMNDGEAYRIVDFSVEYDGSGEQETMDGLIVTRPFDLDEPDVRKLITRLRIRGKYHVGNVKYMLLGSMDGIHWGNLRSLRGGSYKLFRLVILCKLLPEERITWVDVDYQPRFANRLR